MAPPKYAPLASWITGNIYYISRSAQLKTIGWANVTGQVTLVSGIDFTCAQMITTAIAVSSNGTVILSAGATYGILLAIVFSHGIVCSAATQILARLNLFYVFINGESVPSCHPFVDLISLQWAQRLLPSSRSSCYLTARGPLLLTRSRCLKIARGGLIVSPKFILFLLSHKLPQTDGRSCWLSRRQCGP